MTLVESAIGILLVGLVLAAALNTVGASVTSRHKTADMGRGRLLAQSLVTEILKQPYAEPEELADLLADIATLGYRTFVPPMPTELPANRSPFDSVTDYAGWTASPPQYKDGTVMPGLIGFTRSVCIDWVSPNDLDTHQDKDYGIKRVTVIVERDGREVAVLTALKTIGLPPLEACCLQNGACHELSNAECTAAAGTSQGSNSQCAFVECPAGCTVARWELDEGAGAVASDSVGDADGDVIGATWTVGQYGEALYFDGVDDYVTVPDSDELDLTNKFTVTAWVKWAGSHDWPAIVCKGWADVSTECNYWLGMTTGSSELTFRFHDGGYRDIGSGLHVKDQDWSFVAVVVEGDRISFHVDDTDSVRAKFGSLHANDHPLTIGRGINTSEMFLGTIDDLRLHDCVLSPEEIAAVASGYTLVCGDRNCVPSEECDCPADCGPPAEFEQPGVTCDDGLDNDCDGATDCDDINCPTDPSC